MTGFFTSLLYAAVLGGVSVVIGGKAYEKHIKYLTALICTAIIVSPLLSFAVNTDFTAPDMGDGISVDSSGAMEMLCTQAEEDMAKRLGDYIFAKKGIKAADISIQIESKDKELSVCAVTVRLPSGEDGESVRSLIAELFGNRVPLEVYADE